MTINIVTSLFTWCS